MTGVSSRSNEPKMEAHKSDALSFEDFNALYCALTGHSEQRAQTQHRKLCRLRPDELEDAHFRSLTKTAIAFASASRSRFRSATSRRSRRSSSSGVSPRSLLRAGSCWRFQEWSRLSAIPRLWATSATVRLQRLSIRRTDSVLKSACTASVSGSSCSFVDSSIAEITSLDGVH
jgi:hypothetical protein